MTRTCASAGCLKSRLHGSTYCASCLPQVLKDRKAKKLAWWRDYYERVRRQRLGHVKRYRKGEAE